MAKKQEQPAAVGVLLFAVTYTLGSAVSRIAQDFFNDDDLYLQVGGRLFRVGVTEDRILTRFYCDADDDHLLVGGGDIPALAEKIHAFQSLKTEKGLCWLTLRWSVGHIYDSRDDELNKAAIDILGLQENALMVKGGDYTTRLRQIHDQIMVLRGAAFNGMIGFSLCVFGLGATLRREKHGLVGMAALTVPALYFAVALIAVFHHFRQRSPSDPPYMEFTLLILALVGAWLLWRHPLPEHDHEKKPGSEKDAHHSGGKKQWARLVLLSAILTAAAILGWWSTEVFYCGQVIYSYDSQGPSASQK